MTDQYSTTLKESSLQSEVSLVREGGMEPGGLLKKKKKRGRNISSFSEFFKSYDCVPFKEYAFSNTRQQFQKSSHVIYLS